MVLGLSENEGDFTRKNYKLREQRRNLHTYRCEKSWSVNNLVNALDGKGDKKNWIREKSKDTNCEIRTCSRYKYSYEPKYLLY